LAWDSRPKGEGGQRWFHLYPNEKIIHNDTIHWTGPDQNWNYMCADCHSTNLKKNYDLKSDTYSTTWSEINVSCEACHGPGSHHVEWARGSLNTLPLNRYLSPQGSGSENKDLDYSKGLVVRLDERKGVTWTTDPQTGRPKRSGPRNTNIEIETCAPCHSRRSVIWKDYVFGKPYMDTYLPQLLEEGMYYADGQIQGNDPVRAVRIKAATALALVPVDRLTAEWRTVFEKVIDEYVETQLANADRPEAHLNIGLLYARIGRFGEAETEYKTAIRLQPSFIPAYVNLSDLYRMQGRDNEGEQLLREALKLSPQNAEVYHALGLLLVRKKQMSEAIDALEKSVRLKPDNSH